MTTTDMTIEQVKAVKVEDVYQVYSGKPGCACGCRGNYRVNPTHVAYADKDRGYAHDDPKDFNFTQVKKVLKIVQENIKEDDCIGEYFASVEVNGRVYCFYVKH